MSFPLVDARRAALAAAQSLPATIKTIDRLSKIHGADAAAWAVGQITLRERARAKFSHPERMVFTKDGLEMTSHEKVSQFHASLFHETDDVIDGTCGIGGDLLFLARGGRAMGCDLSVEALTCAQWNLEQEGLAAVLSQGSCMNIDWTGRSLWLDPARRGEAGRTLNPDSFSPSLADVLKKAETADHVWIKLTPMLSDSILESAGKGLIFVSHRGECVEGLVQAGRIPEASFRRAFRVDEGIWLDASASPTHAADPGQFVYEADPAAIRGHCLGSFGLELLGDTPGWLTGNVAEPTPWLTPFRVVWSGAWRESVVQGVIREEGARLESVKTRGVKIEPAQQLRRLRRGITQKEGPKRELMLYSQGPKIRALLAERITAQSVD